jgi:hypothetical protein
MCQGLMRETEIRGDLTCGVPTVLNVMQAKTAALTGALTKAARMAFSRAELAGLPHSTQLAEPATAAADRRH